MPPLTSVYSRGEMEEPAHILVVDDDKKLRDVLRRFLLGQGFRVTVASDAADARRKLAALEFDLVLLDIMMPGESGLELTRALRQTRDVPIFLLTAVDELDSRLQGFGYGADDYLAKPFEPQELVVRIRAILRHSRRPDEPPAKEVRFGRFQFDVERGELRDGSGLVRLTPAEVSYLRLLSRRQGQPVSREEFLEDEASETNLRAVDVQITRLRRKIEEDPRYPRYLQTVRGVGYTLMAD